jgi:hypothetical protein
MATQQEVRRIVNLAVSEPPDTLHNDDALDAIALHPLWGMLLLALDLVPDVSGRVQLGHLAHGCHQGGYGGAGRSGAQ